MHPGNATVDLRCSISRYMTPTSSLVTATVKGAAVGSECSSWTTTLSSPATATASPGHSTIIGYPTEGAYPTPDPYLEKASDGPSLVTGYVPPLSSAGAGLTTTHGVHTLKNLLTLGIAAGAVTSDIPALSAVGSVPPLTAPVVGPNLSEGFGSTPASSLPVPGNAVPG